jgi:hypothetical protein
MDSLADNDQVKEPRWFRFQGLELIQSGLAGSPGLASSCVPEQFVCMSSQSEIFPEQQFVGYGASW